MRRTTTLLLTLALAAAVNANAAIENKTHREFRVTDGGTLTLDADVGSINVTTGGSGVSVDITRRVRTSSQSTANDRFQDFDVTYDQSGNDVRVRARYDHGFGFLRWNDDFEATFNVRVPAHYNLTLKTSGGNIELASIGGRVDANTSGGNIRVDRVSGETLVSTSGGNVDIAGSSGRVVARTSGGSISIGETTGPVEARTSGGSIVIRRAGANVIARTSGGSIRVDEALGAIDASTSGGSIRATFASQPRGNSRLATSGGSVTVAVAPNVQLDLDAHTSGGDVDSELPITVVGKHTEGTMVGKINGGGPQLVLRSSGGGITVRKL